MGALSVAPPVQVKERPILFSAPMVRAILEGRKSQTRRLVKPQPDWECPSEMCRTTPEGWQELGHSGRWSCDHDTGRTIRACPYGQPGDRLWVRETWGSVLIKPVSSERAWWPNAMPDGARIPWPGIPPDRPQLRPSATSADAVIFRADGEMPYDFPQQWRPSIHMPRWASRITLEVTDVRVERLQDISPKDVLSEGTVDRPHEVDGLGRCPVSAVDGCVYPDLRSLWCSAWASIHGLESWSANPWVWAISFKRVEANQSRRSA